MKLLLLAAVALIAAACITGPAWAETHHPASQHVVAVHLVGTVEAVRAATWACQRTIGTTPARASLTHAELRAAGWRYLLWVKARWHSRLAGCDAERDHRAAITRRLQAGLAGYPLEPWVARFEQAGRRWNVSPYLMASIAGQESTFGKYVTPGNAWGLGPGIWFPDFGAGIDYLAKSLATSYDMSSLSAIGGRYCPGCSEWPGKVGWFLSSTFGQSTYALHYPQRE